MEQGRRTGGSRQDPTQPRRQGEVPHRRLAEPSHPQRRSDVGSQRRADEAPQRRHPVPSSQNTERRPQKRRKIFPNIWVYLLFLFGVSAVLAALCWTAANDVLALNKPEHSDVIVITESDSFGSVVNQLKDKKIIKSKGLFHTFSFFAGGSRKIAPGSYELNTDMDYYAILNGLGEYSDRRMVTTVTIPEGQNIDQIFKILEDSGVSSKAKLQDMAANYNYAFDFLQEIPLGDYKRLEGYLFPDTYEFYKGENPKYIINKMLVNFDSKINETMRQAITKTGYSIHQIITIASLIEKETDGTDAANISAVIHNRLKNPTGETVGKLQIDAGIKYVLPEGEMVTTEHYSSVDSPYNTYKYQGLPPGPIANPGMTAISAAINPANVKYYYYSLGSDGLHHFFRTYAEHSAFIGS